MLIFVQGICYLNYYYNLFDTKKIFEKMDRKERNLLLISH